MSYLVRKATRHDVSLLSVLLDDYMRETYRSAWSGNTDSLARHCFGGDFDLTVAEDAGRQVIAFAAATPSYDLHHCMRGGEVIDLFVCPSHRGRGVAMLLLVEVAGNVRKRGGTYLKGGAVNNPSVRRLYRRCAMCLPGGECYISGRAFRRLAELAGRSVREVVSGLPEPAWNNDP